jgi:hypothetical protein
MIRADELQPGDYMPEWVAPDQSPVPSPTNHRPVWTVASVEEFEDSVFVRIRLHRSGRPDTRRFDRHKMLPCVRPSEVEAAF